MPTEVKKKLSYWEFLDELLRKENYQLVLDPEFDTYIIDKSCKQRLLFNRNYKVIAIAHGDDLRRWEITNEDVRYKFKLYSIFSDLEEYSKLPIEFYYNRIGSYRSSTPESDMQDNCD